MIDSRTLRTLGPVRRPAAFGKAEHADLHYGTSAHVRIDRSEDQSLVLVLLGELDVTSMTYFEGLLAEVMSQEPDRLVFDLTHAQFISAQAYDAIGRSSRATHVEVRSVSGLAARVLSAYGYETEVNDREASCEVVLRHDAKGSRPGSVGRSGELIELGGR